MLWSAFLWSGASPADTLTWWLDSAPGLLIYAAVTATRRAFPFTAFTDWMIALLLVVIAVGAHYGFAAVPGFDTFPTSSTGRNNFDRWAHFFQGFVPAAVFREVLVRARVAPDRIWLAGLTLALSLALSALYELLEWSAALVLGHRAESFIASQGDPWDAQTDMALALAGAAVMLMSLSRIQDRGIERLLRAAPGLRSLEATQKPDRT